MCVSDKLQSAIAHVIMSAPPYTKVPPALVCSCHAAGRQQRQAVEALCSMLTGFRLAVESRLKNRCLVWTLSLVNSNYHLDWTVPLLYLLICYSVGALVLFGTQTAAAKISIGSLIFDSAGHWAAI